MTSTPALDPADFAADWLGQRVVFADAALGTLPEEVSRLEAGRVLLIAGRHGGLGDRAAALLGGRVAGRISDLRQHVPGDLADAAVAEARQTGAAAIVSAGGGSATGLAKICALETGLPVLAVPTTYAGSEMTPVWGRTDGAVKRTGRDPRVLPRTVIYDPELLAGAPLALTCPSAMNALAHCVEALYAPAADPLTSLSAAEGARLIAAWLPAADAASGGSRGGAPPSQHGSAEATRALLWAACLAGRAHGTAGGSLHHAVCHLLGGFAGLPHAETHAVVLPHVVSFLSPAIGPALDRLAEALGTQPAGVAAALWDLGATAGTPAGLRALGLAESDLPAVAAGLVERSPASPRPLSRDDALALVTAAWHGARPTPESPSMGRESATHPHLGDSATPTRPMEPSGEPMTAAELTATVTQRLEATPDPRLREVMTALIRHLHGFVTDVRLTLDEWLAAIRFLTATGQISDDRRQEFILLSDTLGVSMLVDLLAEPASAGAAGFATESTVLGPFYAAGSPEREYGASIVERPSGELAWYAGRVTDTDGNPIAGATLDIWQNADDMLYAVQNPDAPPDNLRGLFRARPDGSFAFLGVRPTDYPIPADGPVGQLLARTGRHPWRPAHIHVIVGAPGYQSVATHIFDADSTYLTSDAVFAVKASLVRTFERHEPSEGRTASDGTAVPDAVPPGQPWYSLTHDFRLSRAA
jgi:alcohol dehydrogenase class IV/protocatechuate 3,4-dioxygenase beta subunit